MGTGAEAALSPVWGIEFRKGEGGGAGGRGRDEGCLSLQGKQLGDTQAARGGGGVKVTRSPKEPGFCYVRAGLPFCEGRPQGGRVRVRLPRSPGVGAAWARVRLGSARLWVPAGEAGGAAREPSVDSAGDRWVSAPTSS